MFPPSNAWIRACAVGLLISMGVAATNFRVFADPPAALYEVERTADVRFGDLPESSGLCDIYLPQPIEPAESDSQPRWPVVLVVHGGGWATGDKWSMGRHARQLAQHGFAAIAINYRLAPAAKFPTQVDDLRTALVWTNEQASQYGFDLEHVGLYGYSAGGHLVSLIATLADESWNRVAPTTDWPRDDPRWGKLPKIAAVCIGGPPTDFRQLPLDNTTLAYFLGGSRREKPQVYAAASPVCFVSPTDPPFQIIHGAADGLVSIDQAQAFHQALVDANVQSAFETLPKRGHLLAFISPQLTTTMLDFFHQQLDRNPANGGSSVQASSE
ncbi:alpha/beta hydrolase [Stieleria sp. TO1_6]|uniref:alpha/beta hydrolase n=1 Tax=Stieleria tagensis TaxID=2956795 RepID=UPI00209B99E0|nr:alpha/beta hydrolase [Stieleria tagensis]MCO8124457.1 alpha/beta hydrolase [Stieleria tagensis]